MCRDIWLLCVLVIGMCKGYIIPEFNFEISSLKNKTGQWYAEVRLDHEGKNPWDVYVNHTTISHKGSDTVAIVATIIPPQEEVKVSELPGYSRVARFGYYKVHRDHKNWLDALKECEKEGAHLLILNSKEEALEMKKLLKQSRTERFWHWIGVHDYYKEGMYITIFNQPLSTVGFQEWYSGQPDGGDKQNCIYLQFSKSTEFGMGDVDCNGRGPYICEKEITSNSNT
ncbi:Hemolymph lipopolysaccharide-binding protein [Blattella germanica]|nr:Hemolymph lipopolysaccharide-binding protein [Blattella germanica]